MYTFWRETDGTVRVKAEAIAGLTNERIGTVHPAGGSVKWDNYIPMSLDMRVAYRRWKDEDQS